MRHNVWQREGETLADTRLASPSGTRLPSLKGDADRFVVGKECIMSSAYGTVTKWALPDHQASVVEAEPLSAVSLMPTGHGRPSISAMEVGKKLY
jgi:hypothetical protein